MKRVVPPKKYLPVSTPVLTGKPEGGRSPRGKKTVSTHGVYYVSYAPLARTKTSCRGECGYMGQYFHIFGEVSIISRVLQLYKNS